MKRRSIAGIAGFIVALSTVAACVSPASAARVALPGGTPLSVHLSSEISSATAHEGDKFSFSVIDDVRHDGWLVIPAGAQGIGEIVGVENAGSNGHPGKLDLQFDYVYAVDGEKVRVTQTATAAQGEQRGGAASTMTIASYAVFGPLGLFAHNWVKGRDVSITPKTPFSVFVDTTVHVVASDRAAMSSDFAH